jgi:serine/threonine protein kinase
MSVDDPALAEEEFADWLAASAEALAAGKSVVLPDESTLLAGMRPRMEQALAGLEALHQQLGPQRDATPSLSSRTAHDRRDSDALTGLPWQSLGRFQLRRELGRGGFGIVYLAYDPLLGREVALKVPKAGSILTPELRERFYQEARAASGLQHPNLVPVYEVGEVGPVCFIVSAYCAGTTLAQWLKEAAEPIPFPLAAGLIATLAEALQHAHDHGVIHRDLKPANILLRGEGRGARDEKEDSSSLAPHPSSLAAPAITDFGLAKNVLSDDRDFPTRSGAIVGTVNYMAPEQAQGETHTVGPAADQYALGAILYELLTGRPPFQGESALETLVQLKTFEPVPPSRLRPRVPRDLETICLKCLEKDPRKRYASTGALAQDIQRYLRGEAIHARRISRPGTALALVPARACPGPADCLGRFLAFAASRWIFAGGALAPTGTARRQASRTAGGKAAL